MINLVHYDNDEIISALIINSLENLKQSIQMMCLDLLTTALLQPHDVISIHKRVIG